MKNKAKYTIKLMEEGMYNLNRSSNFIIPELIEIILYLSKEVKKLKGIK